MKRNHSSEAPEEEDSSPPSAKICSIPNPNYFPSDVLKFMKQNAKPRMSLKLMQICKYFQHRPFPYLVIRSFERWWDNIDYQPINGRFITCSRLEDVPSNLWIRIKINMSPRDFDYSKFIDKIAVCEAITLDFTAQKIPLHAFKILAENARELFMEKTVAFREDGSAASLDELFECLPNLMTFMARDNCPSIVSLERLNKAVPSKLKSIKFINIDESFNFTDFAEFMITHQNIYYRIENEQIFGEEKLQQLQSGVDKINAAWDYQNLPPRIECSGTSNESERALTLLHHRYNETWRERWLAQ